MLERFIHENTPQNDFNTLSSLTDFGKESQALEADFKMATDTTNLKLRFLEESFTAITQEDINAVKNGSEMWGLFEQKVFHNKKAWRERKEYFESNKEEIKIYAQNTERFKSYIPYIEKKYTGTLEQNMIYKSYLKHILFEDEEKMTSVNNAIIFEESDISTYRFDRAVNENYNFDYTQNHEDSVQDNSDDNIENNLDRRTQNALNNLSANIAKKGIRVKKNAIMIISDIRNGKMIITQNGQVIDEIDPVVFSKKGIGNVPGSKKTPTGSFIIKERGKRALERKNNVTGYFLHLAGLESANANSYARAIGIHGMPTSDAGIASKGTTTHGCTGMTNENIQKLYDILRGKQAFVETIA